MSALLAFARERDLNAAHFTAIGAFSRVKLGYFDWQRKDYLSRELDEQLEVLSLAGDIATREGDPMVHAHAVLGRADLTALGGHLISAEVRPTLEVILVESPAHLRRELDPESGLPLIALR
jgi:predicted DNA-binding protein with PD1-like motif